MVRFAPLREWERQKENLIAFMEEATRFFIIIVTWVWLSLQKYT